MKRPAKGQRPVVRAVHWDDTEYFFVECPVCKTRTDSRKAKRGLVTCPGCGAQVKF
jgi:ribosomal protein L37AE/L43A